MRRIIFAAAFAAVAVPGAAFAQFGGSPDQQVDGAPPPMTTAPRAAPQDQADKDQDVDRDMDIDTDVDADSDNDNRDDPYTSVGSGAPPEAPPAEAAPAARPDGYVRMRPGDHYDLRGGGPSQQAVAAPDVKDQDDDADDTGADDDMDAAGKPDEPPPPDADSPPSG